MKKQKSAFRPFRVVCAGDGHCKNTSPASRLTAASHPPEMTGKWLLLWDIAGFRYFSYWSKQTWTYRKAQPSIFKCCLELLWVSDGRTLWAQYVKREIVTTLHLKLSCRPDLFDRQTITFSTVENKCWHSNEILPVYYTNITSSTGDRKIKLIWP